MARRFSDPNRRRFRDPNEPEGPSPRGRARGKRGESINDLLARAFMVGGEGVAPEDIAADGADFEAATGEALSEERLLDFAEDEEDLTLAETEDPSQKDRAVEFGIPAEPPEGARMGTVIAAHGREFFVLADADDPGRAPSPEASDPPAEPEPDVDESVLAYRVALARRYLIQKRWYKHPVAVGDRVMILPAAGTTERVARLVAIEPRTAVLARTAASHKDQEGAREQVVAANVDLLCIIVPVPSSPRGKPKPLRTGLIDRFLVSAGRGELDAMLVINKVDLPHDGADRASVAALYRRLGVPVVESSAVSGEGVPALRDALAGRTTVFAGQSGVGKTSLLNAVAPGRNLRVAAVNRKTGKGRHTTSAATRYRIPLPPARPGDPPRQAYVVDTPGIREFGFLDLHPADVDAYFPEIEDAAAGCAFSDCTHAPTQSDCGVLAALAEDTVDPRRYESYRSLVESLERRDRRGRRGK